MDCIIIEDEGKAIKRLEQQLESSGYQMQISARLYSVQEAVYWLTNNHTDLIFLDIQLGDGLGFEIFDHVQVKTPVIFTTSYEEYITRAFDVNSISYLLKPVILDDLKSALDKYHFLYDSNQPLNEKIIPLNQDYQHRFLVRSAHSLKPISIEDVAYFYLQNRHFLLVTKDRQQYLYDSTLEILEQRLDPKKFFRISRQCILNAGIIKEVNSYDNGRLKIETDPICKDEMIVSRYRVAEFRAWLNS
jgi:two-component system, LytTR family, response regulator LytT